MQYCSLTSGRFANCTLNCSSSLVTNEASVFRIPLVRKLGFFELPLLSQYPGEEALLGTVSLSLDGTELALLWL